MQQIVISPPPTTGTLRPPKMSRSISISSQRMPNMLGGGLYDLIKNVPEDQEARDHWAACRIEQDKVKLRELILSRTVQPVTCELCGDLFCNLRERAFHFELDHSAPPRPWAVQPEVMNDILRAVGRAMDPARKMSYDNAVRRGVFLGNDREIYYRYPPTDA